ncbi:MAG TPA: glycosyl hydrolase family 65 protein [Egibacteraceae bacterium]|nr:glycosyl hydrolase family 65 protein [Egibacteraceae bacterium]
MSAWSLVYDGFEPEHEGLREALCTLGNGYFATRGAAPESSADDVHYPGTYAAGLFNRLTTRIAGRVIENEDLVNLPNWLSLSFRLGDGGWFDLRAAQLRHYRQELDLRRGVLSRQITFGDGTGRETRVVQRRFVHLDDVHLAALETTFEAVNWSGQVTVRAGLDGRVANTGVARYRQLASDHLDLVAADAGSGGDGVAQLQVRTNQSRVEVAQAARTRVLSGQDVLARVARRPVVDGRYVGHELDLDLRSGQPTAVEKVVALYTSRDRAISEPALEARKAVADAAGFEPLLARHALAWEQQWRRFAVDLDADERTCRILNLHLFHLLQVASPAVLELDVGVPARGLHGEAYRGHVFWDELFILPLLDLRRPLLTQALLGYRRRRLGEARRSARRAGHAGADYPWQSGSNGREESQRLHLNPRSGRWIPDHSHLQKHINVAVAYNFWQHYQVTGDLGFLRYEAAEPIIEIARYLASLASYDPAHDRYRILGVMGPDEYHDAYPDRDTPGVDDNAYTNVMAVWVWHRALGLFERLPAYHRDELSERLGVSDEETARWTELTRRLRVPFHDGRIISQFDGYDRLVAFDWDGYRARYGDIQRLDRILEAEGDSTNRYQVSKQADVLMLFYLLSAEELTELLDDLGYQFQPAVDIPANINYYLARSAHGSTLSKVVHSWVLARSDRPRSWRLFVEALEADISDVQGGTTPEGVHLGAMAGTVDLVQRGYTGIVTRDDVLWLEPALPDTLSRLRLKIHYRHHRLDLTIDRTELRLASQPAPVPAIQVGFDGQVSTLEPGGQLTFLLRP